MAAIGICTDFVNLPDVAALGFDYVELSLAALAGLFAGLGKRREPEAAPEIEIEDEAEAPEEPEEAVPEEQPGKKPRKPKTIQKDKFKDRKSVV